MAKKKKLKIGDIFSIKLDNNEYAFGRCMTEVIYGNVVEIFNYFSTEEKIDIPVTKERLFPPIIIDTFSLFKKRDRSGDWKVIGHEDDFELTNVDNLRFWGKMGEKVTDTTLIDIYDNIRGEIEISKVNSIENRIQSIGLHFRIKDEDKKDLIFLSYSPWNNMTVKNQIQRYREANI